MITLVILRKRVASGVVFQLDQVKIMEIKRVCVRIVAPIVNTKALCSFIV